MSAPQFHIVDPAAPQGGTPQSPRVPGTVFDRGRFVALPDHGGFRLDDTASETHLDEALVAPRHWGRA